MTKERFLGQLEYALHPLEDGARAAAVNACAKEIDTYMEGGMSEGEAVARMNLIAAIAEHLKAAQEETPASRQPSRHIMIPCWIVYSR